LKRLIPILSIILLTTTCSYGQSRPTPVIEAAEKIAKFYPNPAVTTITFDLQKGFQKGLTLQVYNFLGKPVHEIQNIGAKTTINLADYNRGVYIYQLRDERGKIIESGKFQVSK